MIVEPVDERAVVTLSSLASDLRRIGVMRGDTLLVHTALSRLGFVVGGAQTVIEALMKSVGTPGTIILHRAGEHGVAAGLFTLHLGGGLSTRRDDGLASFKRRVANMEAEFWIGTRVTDPDKHAELGCQWRRSNGIKSEIDRIFLYRLDREEAVKLLVEDN